MSLDEQASLRQHAADIYDAQSQRSVYAETARRHQHPRPEERARAIVYEEDRKWLMVSGAEYATYSVDLDQEALVKLIASAISAAEELQRCAVGMPLENAQRANDREMEIREAVLREREECAGLAEYARLMIDKYDPPSATRVATDIAVAIRARP